MTDRAVVVQGLSKRYRTGERRAYGSLRDTLTSAGRWPVRAIRGRLSSQGDSSRQGKHRRAREWFWALDGVSFEVEQGEVIGIIGRNGAGKSTLLKILTRITEPTRGKAILRGRVGSLLEVGTGFHQELTGRENVYFNGALLGMTRREIDQRFDEIINFSEVEPFIDTPVKFYSSGMQVRLAFSVAAHLQSEIMLVDEVLSVGDAAFRQRCIEKMEGVTRANRTVLFVSHDMSAVSQLCSRTIWIDKGRIRRIGLTRDVIADYLSATAQTEGALEIFPDQTEVQDPSLRLHAVRIRNQGGIVSSRLDARYPFAIELDYELLEVARSLRIGILVSTISGTLAVESYDVDDLTSIPEREPGFYSAQCEIPGGLLNAGQYSVGVNIDIPDVRYVYRDDGLLVFDIEDLQMSAAGHRYPSRGILTPRLHWSFQSVPKRVREQLQLEPRGDGG